MLWDALEKVLEKRLQMTLLKNRRTLEESGVQKRPQAATRRSRSKTSLLDASKVPWTRRAWGSKISVLTAVCMTCGLVGGRVDQKNTGKYRNMFFSIRRLKRLSWNWRSLLLRGQKVFQIQHDKSTTAMSMKTGVVKQFLWWIHRGGWGSYGILILSHNQIIVKGQSKAFLTYTHTVTHKKISKCNRLIHFDLSISHLNCVCQILFKSSHLTWSGNVTYLSTSHALHVTLAHSCIPQGATQKNHETWNNIYLKTHPQ